MLEAMARASAKDFIVKPHFQAERVLEAGRARRGGEFPFGNTAAAVRQTRHIPSSSVGPMSLRT